VLGKYAFENLQIRRGGEKIIVEENDDIEIAYLLQDRISLTGQTARPEHELELCILSELAEIVRAGRAHHHSLRRPQLSRKFVECGAQQLRASDSRYSNRNTQRHTPPSVRFNVPAANGS
jgi:hypothetical protein